MSFQAYIDNIKAKTGKSPEDFRVLADKEGLLKPGVKAGQIVAWLKKEFQLGHGHAMAIVNTIQASTSPALSASDRVANHFTGNKARWRTEYDAILAAVKTFGADVSESPAASYISLLRGDKKFAIVAVSGQRMDVGIKLKDAELTDRFESSADWNTMVTHRAKIADPAEVDAELIAWLRKAYDRAV